VAVGVADEKTVGVTLGGVEGLLVGTPVGARKDIYIRSERIVPES